MDNSINHPSEAEKNNNRMQQLRQRDSESACDCECQCSNGNSNTNSNFIPHGNSQGDLWPLREKLALPKNGRGRGEGVLSSIIVNLVKQSLKQLLLMWLTGLLMTPLLFHFVISSSIETANAAVLMHQPINSTDDSTDSSLDLPMTSSPLTNQLSNPSLTSNENVIELTLSQVEPLALAISPQAASYSAPAESRDADGDDVSGKSGDGKGSTGQIDCMIDAKKGFSNPSNVYQCSPSQKCCLEHAKPSCCGSKAVTQIIREQVTLWGGLFGILGVIGTIVFCRRRDASCDLGTICSLLCCFLCTRPSNKISMVTTNQGRDQRQTVTNEEKESNSPSLGAQRHQSTSLLAPATVVDAVGDAAGDARPCAGSTAASLFTSTSTSSCTAVRDLLIDGRQEEKPLVKTYPNGKVQGNKSEHRLTHHVHAKTAWMDTSKPLARHFDHPVTHFNGQAGNLDEVIELQRLY